LVEFETDVLSLLAQFWKVFTVTSTSKMLLVSRGLRIARKSGV